MNPQRMQAIMKKLKVSRGCQIHDFRQWIPAAVEAVEPSGEQWIALSSS
jgi:hypothetical protein